MTGKTLLTAVALLGFGIASGAEAGVIITGSNRYVIVDTVGGTSEDGVYTTTSPDVDGPFDVMDETFIFEGSNGGSTYVSQVSNITPNLFEVNLDTRADATGDGFDFASSYAESSFEVFFTLTSSTDFSIVGAYGGAFGAINGETSRTQITIESLGGGSPTQSILDETNDYPSINVSGTLLPGNYKLEANSLSIVERIFEEGFGDANAGTVFTMTLTPEPSCVALLTLGGLMLIRRKR